MIDYKSGKDVIVITNDGKKYFASHVIFTPSLGVLKNQHSSMFKPKLPDQKIRAIEVSTKVIKKEEEKKKPINSRFFIIAEFGNRNS